MKELIIRCLFLVLILAPMLLVSKSQGQTNATGTVRAALKALPVYLAGFAAVTLVMILLEWFFVDLS